jgi:RNA polymerase sigma factor (sigma-70 family)
MATSPISEVISHLRRSVLVREGAGLTDDQLLEDYLSRHEPAALEVLVRRHAAMVWGVCRRVLGDHHDAEDAFQATFLVLVRKAASLASPELLANWLYGVAHQTALKARATVAKRKARERQVTKMPEPVATQQDLWNDLQPLLDQELSRLPDKYRVAIVLCDLEGKTRKEAARQLGVPESTVAARLSRGRVMLAKRLARHGLAVSGGALGVMLAQNVASAGVPTSLVSLTIKTVTRFAAGQAAVGLFSAPVAALTEGVIRTMLLSKLKIAVAALLLIGVLGTGVSGLTRVTLAAGTPPAAARSAVTGRDDGNIKETVLALEKRMWEAHTTQNLDAVKGLLADDYTGTDTRGRSETKARSLNWMANFRVVDPEMKHAKVVVLNAASAIVTYEIRYKIVSPGGRLLETVPPRQVTSAWAQRDGQWWGVYAEASVLGNDGTRSKATRADDRWKANDSWEMNAFFELAKVKREDPKPPKRD